jgi:hypothetical protein
MRQRVFPDFKSDKFLKEFKNTFGRKTKPPKSALKILIQTLSAEVSGPATSITGSPEEGLVVKVMSSATGERIIHHIRLNEELSIINHQMQKIGEPHSSTTIGIGDLWLRTKPRQATHLSDSDVVPSKRSLHSE